eukprot:scaffold2120_cov259-Pinguiococcus_pyrenoidosus.AAC.5
MNCPNYYYCSGMEIRNTLRVFVKVPPLGFQTPPLPLPVWRRGLEELQMEVRPARRDSPRARDPAAPAFWGIRLGFCASRVMVRVEA